MEAVDRSMCHEKWHCSLHTTLILHPHFCILRSKYISPLIASDKMHTGPSQAKVPVPWRRVEHLISISNGWEGPGALMRLFHLIPKGYTGFTCGALGCDHVSPPSSIQLVPFISSTSDQSPASVLTFSLGFPEPQLHWSMAFYSYTSSLQWIT